MGKRGPKPKFTGIACPNNHCTYYGMVNAGNIVGNGTYQTKSRRVRKYICRECDAVFSDRNNTVFYDIRSEESKVVDACRLLVKGLSIRSAADFLQVKEETVSGWLSRAAEHCQEINDVLMKNLKVSKVELDEFWTFVQKQQLPLWRSRKTRALGSG